MFFIAFLRAAKVSRLQQAVERISQLLTVLGVSKMMKMYLDV